MSLSTHPGIDSFPGTVAERRSIAFIRGFAALGSTDDIYDIFKMPVAGGRKPNWDSVGTPGAISM